MLRIKHFAPLVLAFALASNLACTPRSTLPKDMLSAMEQEAVAVHLVVGNEKIAPQVRMNSQALLATPHTLNMFGIMKEAGKVMPFYLELGVVRGKGLDRDPRLDRIMIQYEEQTSSKLSYQIVEYQNVYGRLVRITHKDTQAKKEKAVVSPIHFTDDRKYYEVLVVEANKARILMCTDDQKLDPQQRCSDFPSAEAPSLALDDYAKLEKTVIAPLFQAVKNEVTSFQDADKKPVVIEPMTEAAYKTLMSNRLKAFQPNVFSKK